jgi:hypothetical protein
MKQTLKFKIIIITKEWKQMKQTKENIVQSFFKENNITKRKIEIKQNRKKIMIMTKNHLEEEVCLFFFFLSFFELASKQKK